MLTTKEAESQLLAINQADSSCSVRRAIADLYSTGFNPQKISPDKKYLLNHVDHLLSDSEDGDITTVKCVGTLYRVPYIGPRAQIIVFDCPHKADCPLYDLAGVKVRTAAK